MRVVSWNVNGFRAVLKNSRKRLEAFLDALDADIICLQETKVASTCGCSTVQYSTITSYTVERAHTARINYYTANT